MPVEIFQIVFGIIGPIIILCGVVLILGAINDIDWIDRFPGYRSSARWIARLCICVLGIIFVIAGGYLAAYDFVQAVFFR